MVTFPAMDTRFSVLIPARDRPETLRHTLATVLAQDGDDYEVVVADNCSGPAVRRVIEEFASPRLRHSRSEEILPMAANWERGLALCGGEYVTVVGDDDALVPSALAALRKLVATTPAELITWRAHVYWWPDTIVPWNRNRLYVNLGGSARLVKSRSSLEAFYRGSLGFELVPTIYTSFFHRRLIDEARRRHGGFFVPIDAAPDVSSGILGMHLAERFAVSGRPLSIRGNSGRSNGTAQWARSLGTAQREIFFREERVGLQGYIHRDLVPSPGLPFIIASAKLKCKEAYFPSDAAIAVDLPGFVRELIANLNHDPDAYEENLHDALALADKLGMRLAPEEIPSKQPRGPAPAWGPIANPDGEIDRICVNGDLAGVSDIAAAARLVESMMPPLATFLENAFAAPAASEQQTGYGAWRAAPAAAASARPSMLSALLASLLGKPPQ
jgi:glycosyltransferase involved in cell wall biosynthesis